jgi:hypothetical protein
MNKALGQLERLRLSLLLVRFALVALAILVTSSSFAAEGELKAPSPEPPTASCGNGVVDPGEQCDPYDPNVPVEGIDRFNLCQCDCTLRGRAMPLTLEMGMFYLACGVLLFGLRGSFKRLRGRGAGVAALRMFVGLSLGFVLTIWGALEWAQIVKPPLQEPGAALSSSERQGGNCRDLRVHEK